MLNCQYSFGSMVGAPVVFFIGGFIFALLQSLQTLGNEDIALALAFGQWYMIIPHIAIISGLLLAGNNPNILEGIVGTQRQEQDESIRFLGLTYNLTYPSCYKVAWQWHRGHNKKLWIDKLLKTYLNRSAGEDVVVSRDLKHLQSKTSLSFIDWVVVLFLAALLLGVPFFLAFITAFYTPQVGLSCRSFTFLIYECSQLGQIFLWLWAYAITPPKVTGAAVYAGSDTLGFFRPNGWLDARGFYDPTNFDHLVLLYESHRESRYGVRGIARVLWSALQDVRTLWCCLWYSSSIFFTLVATMTAIGGTLMQLLGVYTADICNLNVGNWLHPYRPEVTAMLSTNSKQMIDDAQKYWKPLAIAAICFMGVVSFVGWWYQRRTRDLFTDQVIKIDEGIGLKEAATIEVT
ncbi:hypothetical protein N0V93_002712 [Gnomoniopsis smithogilvyi]|uniref:Uncharacterized protein n=1 Tax=Gnomoniopsis smithogilvyi TaxID=1191159 RepID=A0A9W8YZC6_9PEZI|nr:hypothetical protein N0V93_002712 [Gnomoniopsis smithogilvyi]